MREKRRSGRVLVARCLGWIVASSVIEMVCVSENGYLAVLEVVVLAKGGNAARLRSKAGIAQRCEGHLYPRGDDEAQSEPMSHDHLPLDRKSVV